MTEHNCSARIYGQRGGDYPCQIKAKIERDGKWYCRIHDPAYIKEKKIKWQTDFDKKWVEEQKQYELIDAMQLATQGLTLGELRQVTPDLIRKALAEKGG